MEQELQHRSRFSWREICVLALLLIIVAAISFPYLLNAREQARRSECKNKLKQIGLALYNYHDVNKSFPAGWIAAGPTSEESNERSAYSWAIACLPYLDASPLYSSIIHENPFQDEVQAPRRWEDLRGHLAPPRMLGSQLYLTFRCSSDRGPDIDTSSSVPQIATSNYVGNFGVGIPRYGRQYGKLLQGIFAENSRIRIRDIRDGTTNVILAGERRMVPTGHTWTEGELEGPLNSYWPGFPRGTSPLAIVGSVTTGEYPPSDREDELIKVHVIEGEYKFYEELIGLGGRDGKGPKTLKFAGINKSLNGDLLKKDASPQVSIGYSSHHPGGCHLLLGDGSVRFVNDSLSMDVLLDLARRSDVIRWRNSEF